MEAAWRAALVAMRASEGGLSDHPDDRGGKTKFGVTHLTLKRARKLHSDLQLLADIRHLTSSRAATRLLSTGFAPRGSLRAPWITWWSTQGATIRRAPTSVSSPGTWPRRRSRICRA